MGDDSKCLVDNGADDCWDKRQGTSGLVCTDVAVTGAKEKCLLDWDNACKTANGANDCWKRRAGTTKPICSDVATQSHKDDCLKDYDVACKTANGANDCWKLRADCSDVSDTGNAGAKAACKTANNIS